MYRLTPHSVAPFAASAFGVLALFALLVAPAVAHDEGDVQSEERQTSVHTIHMDADGFRPSVLEVSVGDTVIFENSESRERWPASNIHPTHTVYPGSDIRKCDSEEAADIFDACRGLQLGETYAFVFNTPGRWRYHDHLWPSLGGEVVVVGGESEEGVEHSKTAITERLSVWFSSVRAWLVALYYEVFEEQRNKRLANVSIVEIAKHDAELAKIIRIAGPEWVMERVLEETNGGYSTDCHQEAHQVGRVSYEMFGASVFELGDASCHSGYYHGAMEAFLAERGTENLAENITALCETFTSDFGIFECLHGVGHGVMAYENYDLPRALDACDELGSEFAARSCYGGVFMENVVAGQGIGAIPGHETAWVSQADPYFPCNTLDNSRMRQYECYQMQTSWMLTLANYRFEDVALLCEQAPEDMVGVCYRSFGRDAAGFTLRDPEEITKICSLVPKGNGYYRGCIDGAVNVIIDFWGPKLTNQAHAFCEVVPDVNAKESCLATVETRLPGLVGVNR